MTEKKTTEDFSRRKLLAASSSLATIVAFSAMAPVQTAQAQGTPQPSTSAGGGEAEHHPDRIRRLRLR